MFVFWYFCVCRCKLRWMNSLLVNWVLFLHLYWISTHSESTKHLPHCCDLQNRHESFEVSVWIMSNKLLLRKCRLFAIRDRHSFPELMKLFQFFIFMDNKWSMCIFSLQYQYILKQTVMRIKKTIRLAAFVLMQNLLQSVYFQLRLFPTWHLSKHR